MKTQIVLLSGKQGSGKTTLQKELIRQCHNRPGWRAVTLNFADPIRKMHDYCRGVLQDAHVQLPPTTLQKDGNLMQLLGTEWGRNTIDQEVWVRVFMGEITNIAHRLGAANAPEHLVIINGDCRFENEFNCLGSALRVRLECPRESRKQRAEMWRANDTHPSETGLDDYALARKFDLALDTNAQALDECATLIMAQLVKDNWTERRHA